MRQLCIKGEFCRGIRLVVATEPTAEAAATVWEWETPFPTVANIVWYREAEQQVRSLLSVQPWATPSVTTTILQELILGMEDEAEYRLVMEELKLPIQPEDFLFDDEAQKGNLGVQDSTPGLAAA